MPSRSRHRGRGDRPVEASNTQAIERDQCVCSKSFTSFRMTLRKIRLTAAVVLVCAIFLPLSRCSRSDAKSSPPPPRSLSERFFPQDDRNFDYSYAYKAIGFSTVGALTFSAFVWPLIIVAMDKRMTKRRLSWILHVVELFLCGWTFYWGIYLTPGRWLYGAYVAMTAVAAFAGSALVFLFEGIRNFVAQRRALKTSNHFV